MILINKLRRRANRVIRTGREWPAAIHGCRDDRFRLAQGPERYSNQQARLFSLSSPVWRSSL